MNENRLLYKKQPYPKGKIDRWTKRVLDEPFIRKEKCVYVCMARKIAWFRSRPKAWGPIHKKKWLSCAHCMGPNSWRSVSFLVWSKWGLIHKKWSLIASKEGGPIHKILSLIGSRHQGLIHIKRYFIGEGPRHGVKFTKISFVGSRDRGPIHKMFLS